MHVSYPINTDVIGTKSCTHTHTHTYIYIQTRTHTHGRRELESDFILARSQLDGQLSEEAKPHQAGHVYNDVNTRRHPENQKYTLSLEEDRTTATGNVYRKFRVVWTFCFLSDRL